MQRRPRKVFEVGLPKMGTRSIAVAAQVHLGLKAQHGATARSAVGRQLLKAILSGYVHKTSYARRTPYVGGHLYPWHELLRDAYPHAMFVWPTRDLDGWLDSCRRHWARRNWQHL